MDSTVSEILGRPSGPNPLPESSPGLGPGFDPSGGFGCATDLSAFSDVSGDSKPYHAKRPHKKSRAGCRNCKTRKVKCNEARPQCRACTKRQEECVYPAVSVEPVTNVFSASVEPVTNAFSAVSVSPPSQGNMLARCFSPPQLIEPLFRPAPHLDDVDMRLLWFYTVKGYDSFSIEAGLDPRIDDILQVAIPRHAFAHRFLLDCLLAQAALELQLLGQPIAEARILTYRVRALAGYRHAIEAACPDSFPALLACSLMLCAVSSQMFRECPGSGSDSGLDSGPPPRQANARVASPADPAPRLASLDWIVVWRGIGTIMGLVKPRALLASGMAPLFARPPIRLDEAASHVPNYLLFMVSSIPPDHPDRPHVDVLYQALKYLGSLYAELGAGAGFSRLLLLRIISWYTFLPTPFVDIVRARCPPALVILAHHLVFLKLADHLWWMRDIADREIRGILRVVDASAGSRRYRSAMNVPYAALATDDHLEIIRLLLGDASWQPAAHEDRTDRDLLTRGLPLVDNRGIVIRYNSAGERIGSDSPSARNIPGPLSERLQV